MTETLKTPQEWAAEDGIVIMDPDGWRGKDDPDFNAPTTYEDYYFRMVVSSIIGLD